MAEENTAPDDGESQSAPEGEAPAAKTDSLRVDSDGNGEDKKSNGEDTSTTNWRDAVADPDMRKIAERFNTVGDVMKAISDFRKRESTSIRVPGADASDEDKAKFYRAIGVPETAEDYEFVMPEDREATDGDRAVQTIMADVFLSEGITAGQAKALNVAWNGIRTDAEAAILKQDTAFAEKQDAELREEWRDDYKRNMVAVSRAAAQFLGDDFEEAKKIETKDGRFIFDHAMIVKMLAKVGREMGEGSLGPPMDTSERETIQDQIDALREKRYAAHDRQDSETAARLDVQERNLLTKLHGTTLATGPAAA